jgi:hypothetical protein
MSREGNYFVTILENEVVVDLVVAVNAYLTALPPVTEVWDTTVITQYSNYAISIGPPITMHVCMITVFQIADI